MSNYDESPEVRSLDALISGSFPDTLSKLSSSLLTIPTNKDFHFLYNIDAFKLPTDTLSRNSHCILNTIGGSLHVPPIDGDDDDAYEWLVNVNDEFLDRIDVCMDEVDSKIDVKGKVSFHIATLEKPQEEYNILVNNANVPFEHVLLEKSEDGLHFIHPLEKLSVIDFVDENITEMKPVKPLPMEKTLFKLVEEVNDLKDLAAKLHTVEEFAVDLEHNQYRSFQGLTCLMQISTRTEDYIVDTFKLWNHIGPCLRELFKDPKKKKVMHGADRDIIWLQRDFGIYVCNLYDTGQASRVLNLERKSLEFLLKHYCGVAANKQYQNADWRIRPLPDVMTRYAREDTHYLLYIYDVMRLDLHKKGKENEQSDSPIVEVYKRSYDVCMQLYEKELLTKDSYLHLYGVQAGNFNAVQLAIVAGLFEWRDPIARENDESTGYVLPNKTLLEIAKEMPISAGKLRQCLRSKLPYIDRNIDALVSVIRRAMQNAAAFEPVVQSLKDWRPRKKNIEPTIEETNTEIVDTGNVSVDVLKERSGGFRGLPSKRKFESDIKVKEEVKVSKAKSNDVIIVIGDEDEDEDEDESDEDTSENDHIALRVSETPFNGQNIKSMTPNLKTCAQDIIVLDDDDSDDDDDDDDDGGDTSGDDSEIGDGMGREDEGMRRSVKPEKFVSKRGFF